MSPIATEASAGAPPRLPAPAPATRGLRALCTVALALNLLHFGLVGYAAARKGGPDFEYFYKAGAWLLKAGVMDPGFDRMPDGTQERRGTIDWYLPFVSRLMTLLAWLPLSSAGVVWLLLNLAAFVTTLYLLGRFVSGLPPQDWLVVLTGPVLLTTQFWHWEFRLNQIDNLTLLLMVAALVLWQRGRPAAAGFWAGLAALLKITPGLLIVWFALKRQTGVVRAAVLTLVLAGPVSDVVVFGPAGAAEVYAGWFSRAVARSSHAGLIANQIEMDWRNQSLAAVACRWLHETSYSLRFDNDPRIRARKPPAYVNVANLPLPAISALVGVVLAGGLVGLLWVLRRPAGELSVWQLRIEWALVLAAMLACMPVLRRYHFIWLVPALVLVQSALFYLWSATWWRRIGVAALVVVATAQLTTLTRLLKTELAEGAGVFLLMLAATIAALLALHSRLASSPDLLPADAFAAAGPAPPRPVGADPVGRAALVADHG